MKKILITILSYFVMLNAFSQKDAKAEKILNDMSKKYQAMKSFKASFSCSFYSPAEKKEQKSTGDITVKGTKFILNFAGREILNNGTYQWTYVKADEEVTKIKYTPEDDDVNPTKIYSIYKKGYKYIVNTEKGVNENSALYDVIDLIPENKEKPIFKIRLVISKKDKTLKSWKLFEKNGNRQSYSLTTFQENITIEDKKFEFDASKHSGVSVIELD